MSRPARRPPATLALAMLALLVLPSGARAATLIQPGAEVVIGDAQCTMNFIYRTSGGKLYVGTAGHCSTKTGERARTEDARDFGTVAYRVNSGNDDFTLIDIDASKYAQVSATVRSFGGPKGYTTTADVHPGDLIEMYGYGIGFGFVEATRPRYGVLVDANDKSYRAETMAVPGDSGGPFIHAPTGKALGIVSHAGVDPTRVGPVSGVPLPHTDIGPTVERILQLCHNAGYNVSLVTA